MENELLIQYAYKTTRGSIMLSNGFVFRKCKIQVWGILIFELKVNLS